MIKLTIGENQGNQRLDRFLKKYFEKASLSYIYKMIRKDVKVNGKRKSAETILSPGDQLTIYMAPEEAEKLQKDIRKFTTRKQFTVIYEDPNILIVSKPFGLLTHGDAKEKKNHLANQVVDYLIAKGDYDPRTEKTFAPSPANRLDRNTTGLVIFGKTSVALQELNRMFRNREQVEKEYLTIVAGHIEENLHLQAMMLKDEKRNTSFITDDEKMGKNMDTEVYPLQYSNQDGGYTLAQVKINTGRTHQIRLQLAAAGYPLVGDSKYGKDRVNRLMSERYGLTTHLLHSYRLSFSHIDDDSSMGYLNGRQFCCPPPSTFESIKSDIFGKI